MHINVKPAALGERPFEVSKVQRQRPLRGGRVWGMAVATLRGMAPPRLIRPFRIVRTVASVTFILVVGVAGVARAQTAPTPRRMAYRPDQPVPAGYHIERRTRYGLAISGVALFGTAYVPTAAAAYFDAHDGTPLYVVPVLGPLFAIPKKTGQPCDGGDQNICVDFDELVTAFFIADAVIQATGLVMAWRGFAGREVLMRDEAPKATLLPGPIGGTGYGAWLTGRF